MEDWRTQEFAYWLGLIQTDGYLRTVERKGKNRTFIGFCSKDRVLVERVKSLSLRFLGRRGAIFTNKIGVSEARFSVKNLMRRFACEGITFDDPPCPPSSIARDNILLGAYLAGVIDGDGDVRIKRPSYPQCGIRVSSGKSQDALAEALRKSLNCGVSISKRTKTSVLDGRIIVGTYYALELLVSKKTQSFFRSFVVPWIVLDRKRNKIEAFTSRWAQAELNRPLLHVKQMS